MMTMHCTDDPIKRRLDLELVSRGLVKTREKAKTLIAEGFVSVNGKTASKPAMPVCDTDKILLTGELAYVGRGGKKLEKALSTFSVSVNNKVALDIGASTGGFTDCLLRNGAKHVYAVDVGSDQLDEELKNDPRVTNMEKTDVRSLSCELLNHGIPQVITVDVSFISITKILCDIYRISDIDTDIIALIKPQFEAGKSKKGIVTSPEVHAEVVFHIIESSISNGFHVRAIDYSPLKGGDGNIEFLIHLRREKSNEPPTLKAVREMVKVAHSALKK